MSEVRFDEAVWSTAFTIDAFIARAEKYPELWRLTRREAIVDDAARNAVAEITSPLRLLVMLADWCTDAAYTIPVVARLIESNPLIEMRVIRRDEHHAIMDAHLTADARSIPVLMVFDASGDERGWWGPRPAPLQAWAMGEGATLERVDRYRRIREWLVQDAGATAVLEVLTLLQRAAAIDA